MTATFKDLSDEQKHLLAWFVDEWKERELTTPIPFTADEMANSLHAFDSKGVSLSLVRYGFEQALDAKKPSDDERLRYASGIIWRTHDKQRSIEDAICEWRENNESDDDEGVAAA